MTTPHSDVAADQLLNRLCDARLLTYEIDVVMFGVEHGLIDPAAVHASDRDGLSELTADGGPLDTAWVADQRRRSVPLKCPVWCSGKHGADFDLDSGWLMVTGKGGVTKPIPVHKEVAKLASGMPAFGWWFPSSGAEGHVDAKAVSNTITNALAAVGSTATAHQLRDTAATRMQRQVKDIRLTQAMLRHSSVVSTMKYTEASNDDLKEALQSLDWGETPAVLVEEIQVVDVAAMDTDQLRALAAQLVAALAHKDGAGR